MNRSATTGAMRPSRRFPSMWVVAAVLGLMCVSCGNSFVQITPNASSTSKQSATTPASRRGLGSIMSRSGGAAAGVAAGLASVAMKMSVLPLRNGHSRSASTHMMAGALDITEVCDDVAIEACHKHGMMSRFPQVLIQVHSIESKRETKGVSVTLAEYKGGAITVEVPKMEVTEAQIESALLKSKKPYKLVPVRFVEEGGTKMGHTVIMNWEAKIGGATVPGSKTENFELELKEDQAEPWKTFAIKMAVGMGQMETKMFPVSFPEDFEVEELRGKDALVQAVVKNIARREDKPPETRSDEELRELLRARGATSVQSRVDHMVDEGVKKALLETCDVDADKVLNAVSWAKFGEKSTLEFKWNCIKEKIASAEGVEPRDVTALLRAEANVVIAEKK